jgi:uncharacterized protein DUF5994
MSSPAYIHSDFMRIVPDSAKSLSCRLHLEPTGAHQGMLDGGWWPRSMNAYAELPGLVVMIEAVRGRVLRLALARTGWDDRPGTLTIGGRVIVVDYFESQPATLLTAFCVRSRVDLLVVSPATDRDAAEAAMIRAMNTGNRVAVPCQAASFVPSDMSRRVWPR